MSTKPIIEKWYKLLQFPAEYDAAFYEALNTIQISADITLEGYDLRSDDGKRNLLAFLYLCEETAQKARARGIGEEILIATGWNFADCLSASATGLPVLMVNSTTGKLTDGQIEFLEAHADNTYTIIGGTGAVSDSLKTAIEDVTGREVCRVFGDSREETSVKVAETYFDAPEYVLLAYSRNFPDGLCGGPLAHAMNAPLLLVNAGMEAYAAAYIKAIGIESGAILGGEAAVSEATGRIVFGLE